MLLLPLLSLLFCLSLQAQQTSETVPFYKQSDRFVINCQPIDQTVGDEILAQSETDYDTLSNLFEYNPTKQFIINIYPDLQSLHKAINFPDAPDWVMGKTENNTQWRVTPRNPGPVHTAESAKTGAKAGLIASFIYEKYPNKIIPRWLHQGIALYKAPLFSHKHMLKLAENPADLPGLEQLDALDKKDTDGFNKLNGFYVSPSMVEFIDKRWGWKTILALLEDYSAFEKILGISKTAFHTLWIQSLRIAQEAGTAAEKQKN